ncbi:MAG TPA: SpoIID/LytB domain-containing protein [Candidatus Baltobacteraceae bacterium]|nr:SpoIID/LytB domain-containing protein [Candidatus Baltobacteraceae bacterium]
MKPQEHRLSTSLVLVMLFLAGFAYGLRWIDQRLAPPPDVSSPSPAREMGSPFSDQLSEGFRFVFGIRTAQAADYVSYTGVLIGKAPVISAAPGELKTVDLAFKNTGRATWSNTGKAYISAYTIKPRYHASVFRSVGWNSSSQTPRLLTPTVRPGETGILRLTITAPAKAGTYTETFQLAAEDTSWMWGAWTPLTVKVSGSPVAAAPAAPVPPLVTSPALPSSVVTVSTGVAMPPSASLVFRSAERIEAPGGLSMTLRVTYHNDGDAAWKKIGLHLVAFKSPSDGETIDDPTWASPDIPVIADRYVPRGQSAELAFTFTTPRTKGDYQMTVAFTADGTELTAAPIVLPIKVIADAAAVIPSEPAPTSPSAPATVPIRPPTVTAGEPTLRVGLFTTEKTEELTFDVPFIASDASGARLGSFSAGASVQFWYDHSVRTYRATDGITSITSALPIRFAPANAGGILTLLTMEDRPTWNTSVNYNRFRGGLEIRKNDRNEYVWVINELPIEQYLKGMKETSAASPLEYQKTMAVAARSYANWHLTHPGKHWHFTVDAVYDQVYKGYVAESQNPVMFRAVDATRGMIVTYDGTPVVTPYYSSSDGRTRAWTEVWGGAAKPWLVSVPAPYDLAAHRPLNGHGVGLSAWDAIGMANAGEGYAAILKHYYTGTDLKKLY